MNLISFYAPNFSEDLPALVSRNERIVELSDIDNLLIMQSINKLKLTTSSPKKIANIRFFYRSFQFYIEVITDGIDMTNRPATFGIYGEIPNFSSNYTVEDWLFELRAKTKQFSIRSKRSLEQEQLDVICNTLFDIWYKNKWKKSALYVGKLTLATTSPLLFRYIMQYFFAEFDIFTLTYLISINNCLLFLLLSKGKI